MIEIDQVIMHGVFFSAYHLIVNWAREELKDSHRGEGKLFLKAYGL